MSVPSLQKPVIFFDGVCGLCNRFVDWTIRRDRHRVFKFAPLQGETAKQNIGEQPTGQEEEWTLVYVDEDGRFVRSSAVIRILTRLGGFWKIAGAGYILPTSWRDALYRFVARRRYGWFGKRETCRMPSEEEKERFLP